MGIKEILSLLGGLALFLFGMQMMSIGLEDVAGNKMKKILEKLTSNRFLGILVGAGITAVIQSSSATTVMVVGFVNSSMMTLKQAVWIIMGANIGTTITGQLIALDIDVIAPLIAFVGVVMIVFLKHDKIKHIGKICAGLGILFIGMGMMSDAMIPLRESETFINLMTKFNNPLLGIVAGAIFTAIIQSSSASVGILQALAIAGLVDFKAAVFVLFGQNIGTCITAVLASIGTSRNAKRTTIIHLLFNLIGTIVFTSVCLLFPITDFISLLSPNNMSQQIANMHTIFNITTTLILLPFGIYLSKIAELILPDDSINDNEIISYNEDISFSSNLGNIAIHTDILVQEINRMSFLAQSNMPKAFDSLLERNSKYLNDIKKIEERIDASSNDILRYISKILVNNNNEKNIADIEQYFLIVGNIERIGDHLVNIASYTNIIKDKNIIFSKLAYEEIVKMKEVVVLAFDLALNPTENISQWLLNIEKLETKIDDMTSNYRKEHLYRLQTGKCLENACMLYDELLTDFERIGDHILNIAQANAKIYTV